MTPGAEPDSGEVTDNEERRRFEFNSDRHTAFVTYEMRGDALALTHTIVPEALGGRGVGTRLVAGVLGEARRRGLKIVPVCTFVQRYIGKHPEAQDLVA